MGAHMRDQSYEYLHDRVQMILKIYLSLYLRQKVAPELEELIRVSSWTDYSTANRLS